MKNLLIVFLAFGISISLLSFVKAIEGGTMGGDSIAEQLFFVTVRIETEHIDINGKSTISVGTGFLVTYKWNGKEGVFLVTNKHVLKNAEKIRFFFIQSDGKKPLLGKTYNFEMDNIQKMWFGHPDDKIDVAIIPFSSVINEVQKRKWQIFYKTISKDLIPTSEQEKDLDAVEDITFVGYPSGIYDVVNYLPVARRGTTATPLSVDYAGLPQFLIDASVFPGSSGSPVFIMNRGSYPPKPGGLVVGSRVFLLGLVSEVYTRNEEGRWDFIDVPTVVTPVVRMQQMIDLGIVVKASTIFVTIDAFLKSKGEIK